MSIRYIPTEVLLKDLEDTIEDINRCKLAQLTGQHHYSVGSVQQRLETNLVIQGKIELELMARGVKVG